MREKEQQAALLAMLNALDFTHLDAAQQPALVSPTSLMPPGLINAMNADEVADLLAYILSGGDKRGKFFKK